MPRYDRDRLTLGDLGGLVVGYSFAAVVWRALWPVAIEPGWWTLSLGFVCFLWLGLAMSGPIVLLARRGHSSTRELAPEGMPVAFSRSEQGWLLLGAYWIGLAGAAWSLRLRVPVWLGALPLVLIGLLWLRKRNESARGERSWTRWAAGLLLWSWPPVWAAMIILARLLETG